MTIFSPDRDALQQAQAMVEELTQEAEIGKVYFGNPAGFLFCADAETGEELWKFEMGAAISVGPAIGEGKVFAGQQGTSH